MLECSKQSKRSIDERRSRYFFRMHKRHLPASLLLCSLLLLLSACSLFPAAAQTGTNTPTNSSSATPTKAASPVPDFTPPTINLTVTGCPSLSVNWDSQVGTKSHVNKVQTVTCGSLEGAGSLTALVNVRYYTPDARLDFYVYDNLSGTPVKRFAVQGLLNGDAKISPVNTIMTAESSPSNTTPTLPNLFKEYQWNGSGFAQIMFPGIFPDMTQYQARQSQAMATANPTTEGWRTSGFGILDKLTHNVLHWPNTKNQVVKYDTRDNLYTVEASNQGPGGGGVVATLYHLDNVMTNIFEISQLASIDGSLVVSSPATGAQLTSPAIVSGSYTSNASILGRVVLYDNTYFVGADTGAVNVSATPGTVNFTLPFSFRLDSKGLREAVVAVYVTNQNNIAYSNEVILVKVFLSA